ncbi:MAG TPA: hypothetical protein DCP17_04820 [Ruminococcaceae bacterium]|nr:hypothetical protein [Oscillospiraceae bacterium]HAY96878.1 hypothetical protein [Oscillospiraceae bacterium]HCD82118.1 hypothetical protein [Oscillospiraceae bacterium]
MDTFFEQITAVKKSGKDIAAITGIWLLAFIICFLLVLFMGYLGSFSFLLIAGALFGAFKLSCRFNVEYEYIVTNGTMDIDKIINKSSRKRVLSFELATVSRLEKFNQGLLSSVNSKEIVTACNLNDPEAYLMVSSTEGKGTSYLIFAPDERVRGAIVKFVPKFIANSAFK